MRCSPGFVTVAAALVFACGGQPGPAATTVAVAGAPVDGSVDRPVPTPYVPRSELPTLEVSAAPTSCPALPTLGADASEAQQRLASYAVALRRLACEPALYAKTGAALAAELGLPAAAEVGFDGPRTTRLTLPEGVTVGDLAPVLGIAEPQVKLTWQAYHAGTALGSNKTSGALDMYSPGTVHVAVDFEVDTYGEDAGKEKVFPAPRDAKVGRRVQVQMSEAAVKFVADEDAVALVVSALALLDADPGLLALKPDEARPRIGLADERYRVAETAIHGEKIVRGLSINPQRTVLPAAAFAAALGLADARATCVNREHNVWNLEVGGTTQIRWRGLELDVDVDVDRSDSRSVPLDGLVVSFMTIYPARS